MPTDERFGVDLPDRPQENGRALSMLEYLDWTISVAAGLGAAYFLHHCGQSAPAVAMAAVTVVVCALDVHNKWRVLRRGQAHPISTVLAGLCVTLGLYAGATAAFYFKRPDYGALVLLIIVALTVAEMGLQIRRDMRAQAERPPV